MLIADAASLGWSPPLPLWRAVDIEQLVVGHEEQSLFTVARALKCHVNLYVVVDKFNWEQI